MFLRLGVDFKGIIPGVGFLLLPREFFPNFFLVEQLMHYSYLLLPCKIGQSEL